MKRVTISVLVCLALVCVLLIAAFSGMVVGRHYQRNQLCCLVAKDRNIVLSVKQALGLTTSYSQIGQDLWVVETAFPGVTNGFFLDVGSWDGTLASNTKLLEERGWTGVCIDPFPQNMEGRTCQMFKEVVGSTSGKKVVFHKAGPLGGIADHVGRWKEKVSESATVELTTVTLAQILERSKAPRFIHFISLDIEGAELDALRGFPFDQYKVGAFAIEHNFEEPKRSDILELLEARGYKRVLSWHTDDFYVAADSKLEMVESSWLLWNIPTLRPRD